MGPRTPPVPILKYKMSGDTAISEAFSQPAEVLLPGNCRPFGSNTLEDFFVLQLIRTVPMTN